MKKRYEEVSQNLAYIQAQLDEHGINAQIQARQLYHDREEVTVTCVACGRRSAAAATSANQRSAAPVTHQHGRGSRGWQPQLLQVAIEL